MYCRSELAVFRETSALVVISQLVVYTGTVCLECTVTRGFSNLVRLYFFPWLVLFIHRLLLECSSWQLWTRFLALTCQIPPILRVIPHKFLDILEYGL